ncbi:MULTISPECIES: AraC family transcriptional regulator [unclassified Streptomyces]|uniref:AraC family transcriptional regulator n=1 Tax=Streptomyces niveiscabiei TaxID=164115 RepID=A0ABW9HSS3_9ACTN|nr:MULTISPECIES: AraC family transcriptional regulator [unclassified Streptomyces]QZZ31665.1 helix-turn-helix domain-containing protein [Streptomyces sp. ST1015]
MVDFASLGIPVVPFAPVCRPGLGLAVTSLGVLRAFGEGEFFASPHRLDFHQVMLVTEGGGHYSIDSDRFAIRPGTLLWTRPNQVVQFVPDPEMNADVIMFTEAFPLSMSAHMGLLDDVLRPSHWRLREGELAAFRRVLDLLREEFTRPDQGLGEELLKHLLAVVLLHIDQMCRLRHKEKTTAFSGEHGELFLRFRRELDRSFATTRLVEEYAAALRCSTRALSRACRAVAGTSAKDVIDARVALEARRLLVHTDLPINAIARQLGFSEVTNFGKFFVRRVNMTPGAFRRESKKGHQA